MVLFTGLCRVFYILNQYKVVSIMVLKIVLWLLKSCLSQSFCI